VVEKSGEDNGENNGSEGHNVGRDEEDRGVARVALTDDDRDFEVAEVLDRIDDMYADLGLDRDEDDEVLL